MTTLSASFRYIASTIITVPADILILGMALTFFVFIIILRTNYLAERSLRYKVLSCAAAKLSEYQFRVRVVAESLRRMSNESPT